MKKKPVQAKLIYDEQKTTKRAYDLEYNKRAEVIKRRREYNRKWRADYRKRKQAEGKCTRAACEAPLDGTTLCKTHKREHGLGRQPGAQKRRWKLIKAGLCPYCKNPLATGKKSCSDCADKDLNRSKLYLYGITLGEYRQMLINAKGVCTICGSDKKIALDHDHATNRVRGILCHNCNVALGLVYDDDVRLRALADYVVLHRALAMPKAV